MPRSGQGDAAQGDGDIVVRRVRRVAQHRFRGDQDAQDLRHYAEDRLKPSLEQVEGVASIRVLAMRSSLGSVPPQAASVAAAIGASASHATSEVKVVLRGSVKAEGVLSVTRRVRLTIFAL